MIVKTLRQEKGNPDYDLKVELEDKTTKWFRRKPDNWVELRGSTEKEITDEKILEGLKDLEEWVVKRPKQ